MSTSRPLSRRTALAGFGAGSLGLLMSMQASASPTIANRETGGSGSSGDNEAAGAAVASTNATLAEHPLRGLWLTLMALPSAPDDIVAVPAFFGADGSAVLIFPCTEATESGVMLKGAAIGTWTPLDDHYAHFTTVQALSGMDGRYHGTVTLDGYPMVDDDGKTFSVRTEYDRITLRNNLNAIIQSTGGPFRNPMRAYRMQVGNAGFPPAMSPEETYQVPVTLDPRPGDPH